MTQNEQTAVTIHPVISTDLLDKMIVGMSLANVLAYVVALHDNAACVYVTARSLEACDTVIPGK